MWAWRQPAKSSTRISSGASVIAAPRSVRMVRWESGVMRERQRAFGPVPRLNRAVSPPNRANAAAYASAVASPPSLPRNVARTPSRAIAATVFDAEPPGAWAGAAGSACSQRSIVAASASSIPPFAPPTVFRKGSSTRASKSMIGAPIPMTSKACVDTLLL